MITHFSLKGDNLIELLKEILTEDEINMIAIKHVKALQYYASQYDLIKSKSKHKFLFPIRKAGFSMKSAEKLGFKSSKHLWKTCLNQKKRNNGGLKKYR